MSHANQATDPIHLVHNGPRVVVTPEDEDRFVLESQQAVSACQNAIAFDRFAEQLREGVLVRLYHWCSERSNRIRACYVPVPIAECVKVFMVVKAQRFDLALNDEIAQLEIDLEDAGWPCDILQIAGDSPEELAAFVDLSPQRSIRIWSDGDSGAASAEG